jgi:peptide-methionine (R)-S-oxide reductase
MTELKSGRTDAYWRETLTPEQYEICRCFATEPPFSGKWTKHNEPGNYVCVACGEPLFSSEAKYDSGFGWPSFTQPKVRTALTFVQLETRGVRRTEIRCTGCESHLGQLFPDGPRPTGLRYSINSLALNFIPAHLPADSARR